MGSNQSSPEKINTIPASTRTVAGSGEGANSSATQSKNFGTSTSNADADAVINNSSTDVNSNANMTTSKLAGKNNKKAPPKNLTGFALVEYKCRKKRMRYDKCHKQKHSAFVVGSKLTSTSAKGEVEERSCDDLFEAYKDCIYKGMLDDRKKRGIKQASPESALGDFYDEDED